MPAQADQQGTEEAAEIEQRLAALADEMARLIENAGSARDWLSTHYTSWEPLEGMTAFVEKRPARYRMLRERAAQGKSSEFIWGAYEKTCTSCGAKALPEEFSHCGVCGAELIGDHPGGK